MKTTQLTAGLVSAALIFAPSITFYPSSARAQAEVAAQGALEWGMAVPGVGALILAGLAVEESVCHAQGKQGLLEGMLRDSQARQLAWQQSMDYEGEIMMAQLHANQALRAIQTHQVSSAAACPAQPMPHEMRRVLAELTLLYDSFGVFTAMQAGRSAFVTHMTALEKNPAFVEGFKSTIEAHAKFFTESAKAAVPAKKRLTAKEKEAAAATAAMAAATQNFMAAFKKCFGQWGAFWDFLSFFPNWGIGLGGTLVGVIFGAQLLVRLAAGEAFAGQTQMTAQAQFWGTVISGFVAVTGIVSANHSAVRFNACSEFKHALIDKMYAPAGVGWRVFQRAFPWLVIGGAKALNDHQKNK